MRVSLLAFCLSFCLMATAQTFRWDNAQPTQTPPPSTSTEQQTLTSDDPLVDEVGIAHFYPDYSEGTKTAFGETFHHHLMTAAHSKLPLGTIVKIARRDNGLSTTVRINDRGAYCDDCVIDLSRAAAQQIDLFSGRVQVNLTVMGYSKHNPLSEEIASTATAEPQFTARGVDQPTVNSYDYEPARSVETKQDLPDNYKPRAIPVDIEQPTLQARSVVASPPPAAKPVVVEEEGISIIEYPLSPFSVQLGSYNQTSNARRHVLGLQEKGFENIYLLQEVRADGSPFNRVIVAPFTTIEDAEDYIDDLMEYHSMKGLVFQTRLMEVAEE